MTKFLGNEKNPIFETGKEQNVEQEKEAEHDLSTPVLTSIAKLLDAPQEALQEDVASIQPSLSAIDEIPAHIPLPEDVGDEWTEPILPVTEEKESKHPIPQQVDPIDAHPDIASCSRFDYHGTHINRPRIHGILTLLASASKIRSPLP